MMEVDKNLRYDRQLRLWGMHGQEALEQASICVISGNATASEILKNLVLPGIGAFTIVDGLAVTEVDLMQNFFVSNDAVGSSRAQQVTTHLNELNDQVKGDFIQCDVESLLQNRPNVLENFTVVVTCNVPIRIVLIIAEIAWKCGIIFIRTEVNGLFGQCRIAVPEHKIIETHPENVTDLRIDHPWNELLEFSKSFDFENVDGYHHNHIPYVLVLLHFLEEWKANHQGLLPCNFKEKTEFKSLIKKGMREPEQENFLEAMDAVLRACQPTKIPENVLRIFSHEKCEHISNQSDSFWIMARALRDFTEHDSNGLLPLSGSLPDMKSDSNNYLKLQQIYRSKAQNDVEIVMARVQKYLEEFNLSKDMVKKEYIERFCKNAQYINFINYKSLNEEYNDDMIIASSYQRVLNDLDKHAAIYITFRAVDLFRYRNQDRYPGSSDDLLQEDLFNLRKITSELLKNEKIPLLLDQYLQEFCRSGGIELHNIASFLGGLASQEIVKLITKQFISFQDLCTYDGITASLSTQRL